MNVRETNTRSVIYRYQYVLTIVFRRVGYEFASIK